MRVRHERTRVDRERAAAAADLAALHVREDVERAPVLLVDLATREDLRRHGAHGRGRRGAAFEPGLGDEHARRAARAHDDHERDEQRDERDRDARAEQRVAPRAAAGRARDLREDDHGALVGAVCRADDGGLDEALRGREIDAPAFVHRGPRKRDGRAQDLDAQRGPQRAAEADLVAARERARADARLSDERASRAREIHEHVIAAVPPDLRVPRRNAHALAAREGDLVFGRAPQAYRRVDDLVDQVRPRAARVRQAQHRGEYNAEARRERADVKV